MKSRARFTSLLVFLAFAMIQLAACSGTPSTFNKVTLTPSGTKFIGENGTITLIASVLNDKANGGVTFTVSPAGTGTLTQTGSTTANYVAPAAVATETVVTITATSVDFPKQSATLTVKIEPPPVITTTSLPTATLNASYTAPVTATGGVPPLAWSIASGTLPAGLSLGSSSTDTVNITGKATTAGQSVITITVTDSTGASNTSGPLTIVVSTLAFTTTSPLPSATTGTAYTETFAATGGTSPYTFTVASGSSLPTGFTLDSTTGILSNPSPSTQGTFTFGITVTDSTTPTAASVTQNFTLVINGPQNLSLLKGSYAFTFSGNNSAGYVAAAGAFTADGNGNINTGEADYNSLAGPPTNVASLKGTYTLGQDGRGTFTFTNVTGSPTYAFAIDASGTGTTPGNHGRFVEFDTTGTRGSGRLEMQSTTTCVVTSTTTTYIGNFAFGGSGFQSSAGGNQAGSLAFAGVFTATPPMSGATVGSLGPAEMDVNAPGSTALGSGGGTSFSGSYQSGADSTHCVFQFSAATTFNYHVYPISVTDAFFIETDSVTATTPFLSVAEMKQQSGQPFLGAVLSGPMAGGVSGQVLSVPYVSVLQLVPQSGITTLNLSHVDNQAGNVTSTNGTPQTVAYSVDQFGRVFTGFAINTAFEPVLYLIDSQDAFVMGQLNGAPIFGEFDAQSQPTSFTTKFIAQDFPLIEGTSAPATSADRDFSGFLTFDGSVTPATVTGTQDESTSAANKSAETVTGTYALSPTGATDGSGTITLTSPAAFTGAFYFVTSTKMVEITTTTGDANPVLIIIGD